MKAWQINQPHRSNICLSACGIPILEHGAKGNVFLLKFWTKQIGPNKNGPNKLVHLDTSSSYIIVYSNCGIYQSYFFVKWYVRQKELVYLGSAEPNTQSENYSGYFIMNGTVQENGKLIFKSQNYLVVCRLQII